MTRKEEIKSMIRKVVAGHLSGNYSVFLFGSQVGLPELKRADIDVGIDAKRPLTNLEESLIWTELEDMPTLYKFDLVDFQKSDDSFKNIALKNIEMI
jgi:predicted nucleotidyltransferase